MFDFRPYANLQESIQTLRKSELHLYAGIHGLSLVVGNTALALTTFQNTEKVDQYQKPNREQV